MKDIILRFLDLFYPLFKRFMNRQNYYYAACGGANMLFDLALFYIAYHFIFDKEIVPVAPRLTFEPYTAALFFAFTFSFPTGFLLSKYVVWPESNIKGRVQLFRYFLLVLINLLLNYVLLKIFVEIFHFYPTISKLITIVIVVTFSYLYQKHFTFKTEQPK